MKPVYVFLLGLLFLFPGVSRAADEGRLVCDSPIFDFGFVGSSASVTNVFTVRNAGDLTFVVKEVRTSCSCTMAKIDKRLIDGGECAEVTVVFFADGQRGPIDKKVYLLTGETRTLPALILRMQGYVKTLTSKE